MAEQEAVVGRPVGTVTMLFTDIEGSTRLLHELGVDAYADVLAAHHRLMRSAVASSNGVEIKTEGDSFFVVFTSASDALCAAAEAVRNLKGGPPSGDDAPRATGRGQGDRACTADRGGRDRLSGAVS